MIPGTTYAAFYDTDSLDLVSSFCGLFWQPIYPLLTEEPNNIFSARIQTLHNQIQYTELSDILKTKLL